MPDEWQKRNVYKRRFPRGLAENDVPVIVLMDDLCGSAGESALNYIRTLDNVLVVGSNSSGYQLCGNAYGYCLPNSGIWACFGTGLQYNFKAENVDFKGYEPDVWCDPKTALQSVLNMMVRGGLCTADTADEPPRRPPARDHPGKQPLVNGAA